MMFMIPIPPTSRLMLPIAASRTVNVEADEVAADRRSCCVWTVKSACAGSPMWCVPSRTWVASSWALAIVSWLEALIAIVLTLLRPKTRWAAVVTGTTTWSSWLKQHPALPFAASTPMTH